MSFIRPVRVIATLTPPVQLRRLEVRSDKRVDVIFNQTTFYPPVVSANVPSSLFVPGVNQTIDLSPLKGYEPVVS